MANGIERGTKEVGGHRNVDHEIIMVTWVSTLVKLINCVLKMDAFYLCKLDLIKVDNAKKIF